MKPITKTELLKFLKSQKGAVVSTISSDGFPESSFIYYVCNDDLNIYFITNKSSHKYQNIKKNPHVSFVVTNEDDLITVQGRGLAKELLDETESQRIYQLLVQILHQKIENWPPPFAKMSDAKLTILKVSFSSLRWADFKISNDAPMEAFYEQVIRPE